MITISCTACQKSFSVTEDLTGKNGKCPSCGQQIDASDTLTHPRSSDTEANHPTAKPHLGHDTSLTDFLAPSQADDELGRLGKYRILKILGHGGMGVVFKAEDPKLKRIVALKAMLPTLAASASAATRFLREAQAM